jgi:pyroglutamyl-peptidase
VQKVLTEKPGFFESGFSCYRDLGRNRVSFPNRHLCKKSQGRNPVSLPALLNRLLSMKAKILLTSFDVWKTHHKSNSSDDLLSHVSQITSLPYSLKFVRKLPVDYQKAPDLVINHIKEFQPDITICCGMAETRHKLTVESNAIVGDVRLKTQINLTRLVQNLPDTEISHNAGKFVCEALYYSVLKHLDDSLPKSQCLFVHVPLLSESNKDVIISDFLSIIHRVSNGEW